MYMSINFGMSSMVVFIVGFLGDEVGLSATYLIFNIVAIGMIPAALLLKRAIP
jgi:FSR family fosmidomycin resistance protein-like MFS transporter